MTTRRRKTNLTTERQRQQQQQQQQRAHAMIRFAATTALAWCAIAVSHFTVVARAQTSCQTVVFSGISQHCSSQEGASSACCEALMTANDRRCFCETSLMTTITMVIGEEGVAFFRDYAIESCRRELVIGEACATTPPDDWGVTAPPPPPALSHSIYNQHRQLDPDDTGTMSNEAGGQVPLIETFFQRLRGGDALDASARDEATLADYALDARRNAEIGFTGDAFVVTGLRTGDLSDPEARMTLFIPTNEAWYAHLFRLGITKEELFGGDVHDWLLRSLEYHMTANDVVLRTESMRFGSHAPTRFLDAHVTVDAYTTDARGNGPNVARVDGCAINPRLRDISVGQSVVHYIDCVLIPPGVPLPARRTVLEYLFAHPDLSMFANAIRGSALTDRIKSACALRGAFCTIFAPNNRAFTDYLADPGVGATFYARRREPGVPSVEDVLLYHVVPGFYSLESLGVGEASKTLDTLEIAMGNVFVETQRRERTANRVFVNGCSIVGEQAFARDGAIHTLSCVLTPDG